MKTKDHRKQELLVAVLSDALIDTRDEADRHFEAKRQTAGAHMDERTRRQNAEQELRRIRSICRNVAHELSQWEGGDELIQISELLAEAGYEDEST